MMYKFSEAEVKKLLKNIVIVVDTREQVNDHIKNWLDKKKLKYKVMTLDQGDYSCYIECNQETRLLGVMRDWHFCNDIAIERKNSVDELVQSIKDRDRFEHEFCRLNKYKTKIVMIVEDINGYEKLAKGEYRSEYKKESAIASFETFIARYDIDVWFLDKSATAFKMFKTLHYHVYEIFKNKGYIEE